MESNLGGLLSLVNDWLRFSEAKNAACIAFNTAVISVLMDKGLGSDFLTVYLNVVLLFAIVSTGLCLISFLPSLSMSRNLAATTDPSPSVGNILFFGSIAEMGIDRFKERASVVFSDELSSPLFTPLVEQIFINSVITRRKLKLFNVSVFFAAAGMTFGLSVLVWAIMKKNGDLG